MIFMNTSTETKLNWGYIQAYKQAILLDFNLTSHLEIYKF